MRTMTDYVLTSIKQTKKGRYALFCDDEFLFSVDEEVLLKHDLHPGRALSAEDIEELKQETDYYRAKQKAYRLLTMRDHSEKELLDKLKKDFDEPTAVSVVEKLRDLELLDDMNYAENYYRELIRKGNSGLEIRQKMSQRGIDRETVDLLMEGNAYDEESVVVELVNKKYLTKLSAENGALKVMQALLRKGFSMSAVRKALQKITGDDTVWM